MLVTLAEHLFSTLMSASQCVATLDESTALLQNAPTMTSPPHQTCAHAAVAAAVQPHTRVGVLSK
jgi:hypothetical protein